MTEQPQKTARTQVMQAAGLVGVALLISRVLGLVRDIVTKTYLPLDSVEMTAYDAANRLPEFIFLIIAGGAIGSAFIPTFTAYFARDDENGAWQLFSNVINLVLLTLTIIAGLAMLFAPQYVTFFMADLVAKSPELLNLTVKLMRVMLFSTVIFGASGVIMGALNARQHFLLPAVAPIVYNLGIIACAVLWAQLERPVEMGLAVGAVVGAAGHLLIQLPGLKQKRVKYTAVANLRDKGVQQVLKLMAPRVLGLSFSELNYFIILYLTGSMARGSYPAINQAGRLLRMPLGILGQAMGIAAFPTLAELAAKSAYDEMRQIIIDALRLLIFLGVPAVVLLMMLGEPLIALLFERGAFSADATALVTAVLTVMSTSLLALLALEVVARSFYSLNDTLTPVLAGGVQALLMGLLSLWLSRQVFPALGWLPVVGVALGYAISNYLEVGVLLWLLQRRINGLPLRSLLDGTVRMAIAGLVMAGAIWATLKLIADWSAFWQLSIGGMVGGLVYIGAVLVLRIPEAQQFWSYGRRRIMRR